MTCCKIKYIFLIFHIVFGLDLGYVKCRISRSLYIRAILTLIPCFVLSPVVYKLFVENISLGNWPAAKYYPLKYIVSVFIFAFTKGDNSFYKFSESLCKIDVKINVKKENYARVNIVSVGVCSSIAAFVSLYSCVYRFLLLEGVFEDNNLTWVLIILQKCSFYIGFAIHFLIFYFSYHRMRALLNTFANSDSNVLYYLSIYKDIADAVEKAKKPFEYLYTFALLVQVPIKVYDFYLDVARAKYYQIEVAEYAMKCFHWFESLIFLSLPTVSAGLLTTTALKLEEIIQNRLLQERRESHYSKLELFKMYVSARPMRLTLFELISLDWTLPLTIINMCIAYQIILVQHTHLY